jgi:hypothetical protein
MKESLIKSGAKVGATPRGHHQMSRDHGAEEFSPGTRGSVDADSSRRDAAVVGSEST